MPNTTAASNGLVGNVKDLVGAASAAAGKPKSSSLGKDAFLQLLVSQLKNQDPMKPMDNEQFISQMAQFSSLEQMQNLNTTMSAQASFTNLTNASGMIGKFVSLVDGSATTGTGVVTGKVDEVRTAGGKVSVVIGGKEYDATTINQVSSTAIDAASAQAAADAATAAAAVKAASAANAANGATSGAPAATASTLPTSGALASGSTLPTSSSSTASSPAASALGSIAKKSYSLQGLHK